ncbi:MAG: N-acetyltransferase family protein [Taibaiella sp.]|jgi:phosphinothricin acetyltransferase
MENNFEIRLIKENDASAILEIYKPYVLNTAITFEYDVPTIDEYLERIKVNTSEYPWLVCTLNEKIIGYAYASKFRYRTAYQWSPESTIYLSPDVQGKGIARILYKTLFSILELQGYFNVYAGVAIPNAKSEGLHLAVGFTEIGVFKNIGYKLGRWHDTRWFQLILKEHESHPAPPEKIGGIENTPELKQIIAEANNELNTLSIRHLNKKI